MTFARLAEEVKRGAELDFATIRNPKTKEDITIYQVGSWEVTQKVFMKLKKLRAFDLEEEQAA